MAETNYIHANARFAFRSDTLDNWRVANPILLAGELGIVTNGSESEKVKIGDGITSWNNLGWWKGPKGTNGKNYLLTETDKQEIINKTYQELEQNIIDAKNYTDEKVGDIETAIDNIIALQIDYIGGDT